MKKSTIALITIFALGGSLAAIHVASGATATSPEEAQSDAVSSAQDMPMMPMRHNMQRMLEQMTAIQETTDPESRERLLEEHMQTMQGMMQMMHGMMAGQGNMSHRRDMMGHGMMGHGRMSPSTRQHGMMAPCEGMPCPMGHQTGNVINRMYMMEQRMNMMQMMMDQMLQNQAELLEQDKK